jgi:succinylarginine dihydrolase
MNDAETLEVNFDGLIGPSHNYAGLAPGNLASRTHRAQSSNPRAAALQGLAKMSVLMRLGVPQAVLPPQPRPNISLLRRLGFRGTDADMISDAARQAPHLLAAASSSSSMWTANAATVCPSADSTDGRVHFTPANLVTSLHRASETDVTAAILKAVFADERYFTHHEPLPASSDLGDEGAANHTRFCQSFGEPGVQFFVYGADGRAFSDNGPLRFTARQTRLASESVARKHGLSPSRTCFAQQHPSAIDAGVFHNDVIAVGHRNTLLCHELSFVDRDAVHDLLRQLTDERIRIVEVKDSELSLAEAVSTYLFNSQLVTSADGRTILIAPTASQQHPAAASVIQQWIVNGVIDSVEFVDLTESMANGGGPACLRLRVVLSPSERNAVESGVMLDDIKAANLTDWVHRHYRERLMPDDLRDPCLMRENHDALDELTKLLSLGSIYEFQR